MTLTTKQQQLLNEAKAVMDYAYVPYSQFRVGAAVIDRNGHIYRGCNIENVAYGPTNCAERTALFSAIASGAAPRSFEAIAVIGNTTGPITPCGVCRQVLIELCGPDTLVIMGNVNGDSQVMTVEQLLPGAFTSSVLSKEEQ